MAKQKIVYKIISQPDASYAVVTFAEGELPRLRPGFATVRLAEDWIKKAE